MLGRLVLCALLVFAAAPSLAYETYEGYRVLEIVPENDEQLTFLHSLASNEQICLMYGLDFWREPSRIGHPVHVMLNEEADRMFKNLILEEGLEAGTYIDDVSQLVDTRYYDEDIDFMDFDYSDYNTYEAILGELEALVQDCPSDFSCETYSIGESVEGRDLMVFRLYKEGAGRRAYWMDSLIHAREWLAGATLMQILNTLVREYDTNDDAKYLVDSYDWYALPVMNPDGYSYTWTDERMWRKNRGSNPGTSCIGTDLNRNYDFKWGGVGSSSNPCSNTYRGAGAASEPETQVVQAEMARVARDLDGWVSMHSYSQYWLNPWGDCAVDPDGAEMLAVSNAAADASEAAEGDTWDRGNWCQVLYPSTGILQDYVKDMGVVRFTTTPELRDDGFGFAPPPSSIPKSVNEIWAGLKAFVRAVEASRSGGAAEPEL